jgi:hypothetical protein
VGKDDFDKLVLVLKSISGEQLRGIIEATPDYIYEENNQDIHMGYADFIIPAPDKKFWPVSINIGQYYKVQVAFIDASNDCGYYSTVGVIKCTNEPTLSIQDLKTTGTNNSQYTYKGTYHNADASEKVYNYYFNIYNDLNELYETSGILLHKTNDTDSINDSSDEWSPIKTLFPGKQYTIEYGVETVNLLNATTGKYTITDSYLISPPDWFDGRLHATVLPDDGCVELSLHGSNLYGEFILSRSSSKDNFEIWNKITEFTIAKAPDGLVLWRDYTVECGVEYLYSIQMYNDNKIKTIHIVNDEYKITADFEDMFLSDGVRQLKVRFNPKVTSFKTTKLEQKIDTIGSQFPFFFRNGNVEYKEFPISGLISCLSDENQLFLQEQNNDDTIRMRTPSDNNTKLYTSRTQLTAENIQLERNFKLEVLNWLNNG